MYEKSKQKIASKSVWANIKRNPFRARRKAVSRAKRKFDTLDFPQLLRECEILTANREKHYCFHFKEWTKTPVGGIQK